MSQQPELTQHQLGGAVVHPWHIDQFGHMNVRWFAHFFDDASFLFFNRLGLDQKTLIKEFGVHTVTAQSTTEFRTEVLAGTCVDVLGSVSRIGEKSLGLEYRMCSTDRTIEYAICKTIEVLVDAQSHSSLPIPSILRERLELAQKEDSKS